jgi:hypothetical protein
MYCENASGNHKLKFVVIGKEKKRKKKEKKKRKEKQKYTPNCIPVHYYNQKGAWMNREIFGNWFHKHFVPEVWAFLRQDCHRKQCYC